MKFIKRLALDRKNQTSDRFAVNANVLTQSLITYGDQIVTTAQLSFQLPSGATSDRPYATNDGQIRYNTTLQDSEIYNGSGEGTGWEKIKTNRQGTITPQNLGVGNYLNTVFGPLSYDVDIAKPQNVLVFVDNVYQIPTTNYTLQLGSSVGVVRNTSGSTPSGTSTIVLSSVADVLVGETITAASGIAAFTTVTSVTTSSQSITISNLTTGVIPDSTPCTFSAPSGTARYVQFTGAVPNKQVFVLLGFDGYSP